MFLQLLRPVLGAGKYQRQAIGGGVEIILQKLRLFALRGEMERLAHLVGGLARRGHLDAPGVGEIGGGEFVHLLWHGGRKQHRLARRAQKRRDAAQGVDEAQIEHLIGFVQHQMAALAEIDGAPLDQIDEPARRGHEDIRAARKLPDLAIDGNAADNGCYPERRALHILAKVVGDLVHQFAGGRQNERARRFRRRALARGEEIFDQRQAEGGRLAGARLGEAEDIVARKRQRDRLRLNGGGGFVARLLDGFQDFGRKAQICKFGHV